ncbi:MAG TPA: hypothetical protein VGI39_26705 [Polyangiaceae bacterium]|jgi:hypothetical protein
MKIKSKVKAGLLFLGTGPAKECPGNQIGVIGCPPGPIMPGVPPSGS